jgi:hypothetical protein
VATIHEHVGWGLYELLHSAARREMKSIRSGKLKFFGVRDFGRLERETSAVLVLATDRAVFYKVSGADRESIMRAFYKRCGRPRFLSGTAFLPDGALNDRLAQYAVALESPDKPLMQLGLLFTEHAGLGSDIAVILWLSNAFTIHTRAVTGFLGDMAALPELRGQLIVNETPSTEA